MSLPPRVAWSFISAPGKPNLKIIYLIIRVIERDSQTSDNEIRTVELLKKFIVRLIGGSCKLTLPLIIIYKITRDLQSDEHRFPKTALTLR